jgi:hypothetical protein
MPQARANLILRERLLARLDAVRRKGGKFLQIFEPVELGKIQCPFTGTVSWTSFITSLCNRLPPNTRISSSSCWKVKSAQFKITEQRLGKTRLLASVLIVRFLALLETPSDFNLAQLLNKKGHPFSHYCASGLKDSNSLYCVNGVRHGAITTRDENEDRKKCTYGARCLCKHNPKCIFVDPSGNLKPCLMNENCVPLCEHGVRCY